MKSQRDGASRKECVYVLPQKSGSKSLISSTVGILLTQSALLDNVQKRETYYAGCYLTFNLSVHSVNNLEHPMGLHSMLNTGLRKIKQDHLVW